MARFDMEAMYNWDAYELEEEQGRSWDAHIHEVDAQAEECLEEMEFNGAYSVG